MKRYQIDSNWLNLKKTENLIFDFLTGAKVQKARIWLVWAGWPPLKKNQHQVFSFFSFC